MPWQPEVTVPPSSPPSGPPSVPPSAALFELPESDPEPQAVAMKTRATAIAHFFVPVCKAAPLQWGWDADLHNPNCYRGQALSQITTKTSEGRIRRCGPSGHPESLPTDLRT